MKTYPKIILAAALITGITVTEISISRPVQAEGVNTPTATTTTPTTNNTNQVPTSVNEVGESGENIYDAAKAFILDTGDRQAQLS